MSTADFVKFRDATLSATKRVQAIEEITGADGLSTIAANDLSQSLLGNTIYANVLMLGFAWQSGLVPVSSDALLRAIELNGVAVANNLQAFNWGRIAAADPEFVATTVANPETTVSGLETMDEAITRRAQYLTDYQDQALAERYLALVDCMRNAEAALSDSVRLTDTTLRAYFKTLAYKDEYEVARLHAQSGFAARIRKDFGNQARLRFHLAPPMLSRKLDSRGRPRKKEFGSWILPLFSVLSRMKRLRGTPFDVFGRTTERRMERELIAEFESHVEEILQQLATHNLEAAKNVLGEYLEIRGYGPVKEQAAAEARIRIQQKLEVFRNQREMAA